MSEVVRYVPRAEFDTQQRVADFIALARDRLTALVPNKAWPDQTWDVSSSFVRKGKGNAASMLHFLRNGTVVGRGDATRGEPLPQPFGDFARAFVRYSHATEANTFERLSARLNALRWLEEAFAALGQETDIMALGPEVLVRAVAIAGEGVTPAPKYQRAAILEKIQEFCRDHGFLAIPFAWKHGIPRPKDLPDRLDEAAVRRRAERLPDFQAFQAISMAWNEPQTRRDHLMSAIAAICMCVPIRIHEVLQLRTDCLREDQRRGEDGKPVTVVGIRVWPGKGNPPAIKWVPDILVDLARQAVARLLDIGKPARCIARWYSDHTDGIYVPPEFEECRAAGVIGSDQLARLVGMSDGVKWARQKGLRSIPKLDWDRGRGRNRYPFGDVEKAVLNELPRDFPNHNGQHEHPYSGSLVLVRRAGLKTDLTDEGSAAMFESVTIDQFNNWLSGRTGVKSVFDRYGVTNPDGSRIDMSSHGFRHWLNDLAYRKGLDALDIANWSGREVEQNQFYDHQTPAQFQEQIQAMAERAGGLGPLFDAAETIRDSHLISRSEFLEAQIGSGHHHDLGACIHDYSLLPCQKFGDCAGCGENVFTKGDPVQMKNVRERRELTARQLEAARQALDEGDYGADLWVQDHEASLARLERVLAVHGDPAIPDGTLINLPEDGSETEVSKAMRLRAEATGSRSVTAD